MPTQVSGVANHLVAEHRAWRKQQRKMSSPLGLKPIAQRQGMIAARPCVAPNQRINAGPRPKAGQLAGEGAILESHRQMTNQAGIGTVFRWVSELHGLGKVHHCIVSR